jgi:hypothetical protein
MLTGGASDIPDKKRHLEPDFFLSSTQESAITCSRSVKNGRMVASKDVVKPCFSGAGKSDRFCINEWR